MKIYIVSDLHNEFQMFIAPDISYTADVIVLAGDIWKRGHGIYWAREMWPDHPIIYVAGNHEFYGRTIGSTLSEMYMAAEKTGVHFLENKEVIIDGYRFLGCTLWTDFRLFGDEMRLAAMRESIQKMNDFRVIHTCDKVFSPVDAEYLHHRSVKWLEEKLSHDLDSKTVVVTHHLPSAQLVAAEYADDLASAAFASRREELLGRSALWVAGHTHTSFDISIKGTRVIVNPRGYLMSSGNNENHEFNDSLIVEI